MAQDFQLIGEVSPDLAQVVAQKQGWQGEPAEPLGSVITDATDYTWNERRANRRNIAGGTTEYGPAQNWVSDPPQSMAEHTETPMAAVIPNRANEFGPNDAPRFSTISDTTEFS